jgi:hypothetical protein
MKRLAIASLLLSAFSASAHAACSGSGTNWSCTAGSTVSQVQTAINSASDGATINFDAGAYNWTSGMIQFSNSKGVTLNGGGGATVTAGSNTFLGMNGTLSGNNTKVYRVTGFTFSGGAGYGIWIFGPGTLNNLRIDRNVFTGYTNGIAILLGELTTLGKYFGVIDRNTFRGSSNFMALKVLGPGDPKHYTASPRGTASNLYIEDNTWDFTSASDLSSGCVDAWNSASVVFRNNTVKNCLVTSHGIVHNGGVVNFEFYSNSLQRTSGSGSWTDGYRMFHHQGSGEVYAFNNTFSVQGTPSSDLMPVTHYRSSPPGTAGYSSTLGMCDGTRSIDGNFSGQMGYPCWMQPGRAAAGTSPAYGTLAPMYAWNNVANGSLKRDLTVEDPWGDGAPSPMDHIKPNRDYYNAVSGSAQTSPTSPFNGTTGMGFGTRANRPTTCTTGGINGEAGLGGVGYFATDENTLYRCAGNNTWVAHYKPFTYPHPLTVGQASTSPPPAPSLTAPTNLRVVQ